MVFRIWGGGGQRQFGTFPKNLSLLVTPSVSQICDVVIWASLVIGDIIISCIIIGSLVQIQGRWQLQLELVHILNHQTNQSCYIEVLHCGNCIIIGPSWLHNCSWSIFGWVLYTLEFYPLVTSQMHHHSKSKRGNNCILDIKGWGTFSGRLKMLMVAVCHCIWLI